MSGPDGAPASGLLGQDDFRKAFRGIGERLRRQGIVGHIYLVGGAAMALAYDAERVTRDADALIVEAHRPITRASVEVAEELGLPRSWLNEQASAYLPRGPDPTAPLVFDHPNLKVTAASAQFVLAMKARAARPRDLVDLQHLAELLELTRLEDLVAVHDAVFPGEPLPARTVQRLRVCWKGRERG